jgi:hypothetical protein
VRSLTVSEQYKQVDRFDRMHGALVNLPDVAHSKPSTVVCVVPMIGDTTTFIVQTYRQRDVGDTIFLQYMDGEKHVRLVIPPQAADAIARQRDSLTTKVRRAVGKATAAARKARGELPGFMKGKRKAKKAD